MINESRLSIGKSAKLLGVSVDTIRRWEKSGRITSFRSPGGHRYFLREDLNKFSNKRYTRYSTPKKEVLVPKKNQSGQTGSQKKDLLRKDLLADKVVREKLLKLGVLKNSKEIKGNLPKPLLIFLIIFLTLDLIIFSFYIILRISN